HRLIACDCVPGAVASLELNERRMIPFDFEPEHLDEEPLGDVHVADVLECESEARCACSHGKVAPSCAELCRRRCEPLEDYPTALWRQHSVGNFVVCSS